MKKLLLGAMLAAACITTDVNAGLFRSNKDKIEVDATLKDYAGKNYEEVSRNIINHINDLKTAISTIKTDKNNKTILKTKIQIDSKETKTATKILDVIIEESEEIYKFFKSMTKKDRRTDIAKKGKRATTAAGELLKSLKALKGSESTWKSFKDELKTSILTTADELKSFAENAIEGTYITKKGKGEELNVKALLTSLSTSFESIRGLFADEPSSVGTDQNQPNNENLLNNNAGNGENTPILIENNNQSQSSNEAPSDNNGGNTNTASQNQPNKNNSLKQRRL